MPISRSQMNRQLRMGGGIMSLEPRQQYGLGSIVKSIGKGVKSAVKGVKKFAKSDIGKLALLAAGGYYAGGGNLFGLQRAGMSGFSLGNLPGAGFFAKTPSVGGPTADLSGLAAIGKKTQEASKFGTASKIALGGSLLGGMFAKAEQGDEEAIAATRDVNALRSYLDKGYRNLGYKEDEIPGLVEEGVAEYTSAQGGYANGGRIGYADGTEEIVQPSASMMVDTTTYNPIPEDADRQGATEIAKAMMAVRSLPREEGEIEDTETMSTKQFMTEQYLMPKVKELVENFGISEIEALKMVRDEMMKLSKPGKAMGGRINRAYGSDELVEQASGIEGLDININPKGVKELDLRDSGGFIPPVGVKEKADDIPAMLSNNEFVFTADAVRGMGDGNVNKGAQRMYDMMKKLENGGRV